MKENVTLRLILILLAVFSIQTFAIGKGNIIWKIGDNNKSAKELSLASGNKYEDLVSFSVFP